MRGAGVIATAAARSEVGRPGGDLVIGDVGLTHRLERALECFGDGVDEFELHLLA